MRDDDDVDIDYCVLLAADVVDDDESISFQNEWMTNHVYDAAACAAVVVMMVKKKIVMMITTNGCDEEL